MEEFLANLNTVIEEREDKLAKRKELIKDLNDFSKLYEELKGVILELENKYNLSQSEEDKKELEEYLKEKILYQNTIKEFMNKLKTVDNELNETPEEIKEVQKNIYDLFKKREKYIFDLKKIELKAKNTQDSTIKVYGINGVDIFILQDDQKKYTEIMHLLGEIDLQIKKNYQFLSENDYINIKNNDQDNTLLENNELDVIGNFDFTSLIKTRENILKDLKEIENSSGRKITYKDKYHGVNITKRIPRHLKSKYGILMYNLKRVEKILNNEYLPKIEIDVEIYDNMVELQKIQYLANLMLQIEAQVEKSNLPYIINGKVIPFEYKEIYEKLLIEIKKLQQPKTNYYSYTFDQNKYNNLDFQGKLEYIDDLAKKIINNFMVTPQQIIINGKKYIINEKDIPLFQKLNNLFEKLKKESLEEVEKYNYLNNSILNNSTITELSNVTINNEIIQVPNKDLKKIAIGTAKANYIKNKLASMNNISFDEAYFDSLDDDQKISYCQQIISTIIMQNKTNPVSLYLDGKEVIIDALYTKTFTKAVSNLLKFKTKDKSMDLFINEEYVSTLNKDEQMAYYLLLIHDICNKPITNKCQKEFKNKIYTFDKKYEILFENIVNKYQELAIPLRKPITIIKKSASKNIEKLKKTIKIHTVQIALAATALMATVGMCKNFENSKEQKNEYAIEIENQQDDIKNNDNKQEINNTIQEENNNLNNEVDTSLFGKTFTLNDGASIYDNEYLENEFSPKYKTDNYRVVAEHYKMPDGSKITVKYDEENWQNKLDFIKENGGVLESVSGVAKSGEENYLENKVPTGVLDIDSINIFDNQGRGR